MNSKSEATLKTLRRLADVFKMACDWDALEALEAAIKAMEDTGKRFSPKEVSDALTDAADTMYKKYGTRGTVRFTPSQVMEILEKAGE